MWLTAVAVLRNRPRLMDSSATTEASVRHVLSGFRILARFLYSNFGLLLDAALKIEYDAKNRSQNYSIFRRPKWGPNPSRETRKLCAGFRFASVGRPRLAAMSSPGLARTGEGLDVEIRFLGFFGVSICAPAPGVWWLGFGYCFGGPTAHNQKSNAVKSKFSNRGFGPFLGTYYGP